MWRVAVASVVVVVLLGGGSAAAAEHRWTRPVAGPTVRGFEAPATRYSAGHRGIDLAASVGAEVRSPDDGRVAFAGRVAGRPVLSIDHDGVRSTLEPVDATVAAGDAVHRGQRVGRIGTGGGHASGVLHLGARVRAADGWDYVSPLLFLGGARRAVLLPLAAFPG